MSDARGNERKRSKIHLCIPLMGWCQVIQWLGDFSIDSPNQLHSRFIITKLLIRNDFLIRAHRGRPFAPLHKTTFVICPRRISQSNVMDAWPQFNHSQADNLCWVFVRRVEIDDWFLVWHISCAIRICFRFFVDFRRFSPLGVRHAECGRRAWVPFANYE